MVLPTKGFFSLRQYLALERKAEYKNEYWKGQIFPMTVVNAAHVLITGNLCFELYRQFEKKGCLVYGSSLRIRTSATGLYTYPDVSAVAGKSEFATRARDTLVNPVLLAEVLSPSTERYDRIGKFALYSGIATLREYLLISTSNVGVERYLRRPGGKWQLTEAHSRNDSVRLSSVPATLKLRDLYKQVELFAD
jgi:Uma2 family endonuclease